MDRPSWVAHVNSPPLADSWWLVGLTLLLVPDPHVGEGELQVLAEAIPARAVVALCSLSIPNRCAAKTGAIGAVCRPSERSSARAAWEAQVMVFDDRTGVPRLGPSSRVVAARDRARAGLLDHDLVIPADLATDLLRGAVLRRDQRELGPRPVGVQAC